uniref:Uncharacterized protein n=1 Tax=Ascaris lumbricoides TaxID=6252 RepID=A0A0M3HPH1_ASCLU
MFHRLKKQQSMDGNVPLCETTYEEVDLGVGKLPRYISEARCGGRCMGGIGTCEALYISEQVYTLYEGNRVELEKHIKRRRPVACVCKVTVELITYSDVIQATSITNETATSHPYRKRRRGFKDGPQFLLTRIHVLAADVNAEEATNSKNQERVHYAGETHSQDNNYSKQMSPNVSTALPLLRSYCLHQALALTKTKAENLDADEQRKP